MRAAPFNGFRVDIGTMELRFRELRREPTEGATAASPEIQNRMEVPESTVDLRERGLNILAGSLADRQEAIRIKVFTDAVAQQGWRDGHVVRRVCRTDAESVGIPATDKEHRSEARVIHLPNPRTDSARDQCLQPSNWSPQTAQKSYLPNGHTPPAGGLCLNGSLRQLHPCRDPPAGNPP